MRQYITCYFKKFGIGNESLSTVLGYLEKVSAQDFERLRAIYTLEYPIKLEQMENLLNQIVEKTLLIKRQVNLLGVLCLLQVLETRLVNKSVPREIIDNTIIDAVYKMKECKRVYGYEGLMQFSWFKAILEERCFGIGRLQFEIEEFRLERYEKDGNLVVKGQPSLSVHIPGSGKEFSEKACKDAYRGAVAFFKKFFPNVFSGAIAFTSWTWLLWPNNNLIMNENSNILRFQKDFDIIEEDLYKTNDSIAWRIFGVEKIEEVDTLPENTNLQKKAKEYIKNGNLLGWGFGVFFMV